MWVIGRFKRTATIEHNNHFDGIDDSATPHDDDNVQRQ